MKERIIDFLSNLLSVVLGIIITFTIQGMIDRAADRKNVRSALELVRSELATNMDDIMVMRGYLEQEKRSADYFLCHLDALDGCPADSIAFHSSVIFGNATISVCDDALELLKMSSLFQKAGDNMLSMKIIRAYDSCESTARFINQRLNDHKSLFERSITAQNAGQIASSGYIDIREYLKTDFGKYAIRSVAVQASAENFTDLSDVQTAVDAIDVYLGGKRRLRPVPQTNQ